MQSEPIVLAGERTSANIDPSLYESRGTKPETKETHGGPKAVRAREEIGTVVVQLCLIDGETPTGVRARARGARRSIAISLDASYSRCLSAGTRVSRRFQRSRRKFTAGADKRSGGENFDPLTCREKNKIKISPIEASRNGPG